MNGRKVRQLRSQGGQKRFRRNAKKNRVTAEEFNAAREAMIAEQAEAQKYYEETVAALAEEPQFAILNPFNGESLLVAAQSMIFPLGVNGRGEPLETETDQPVPCTCTVACIPDGITDEQTCKERLSADEGIAPIETEPVMAKQVILPGTAAALGIETP